MLKGHLGGGQGQHWMRWVARVLKNAEGLEAFWMKRSGTRRVSLRGADDSTEGDTRSRWTLSLPFLKKLTAISSCA